MRQHVQAPTRSEGITESCRATPSVDGMSLRDWRNLTSDSSIQILNLEMDETFLNGLRNNGGFTKDLDQTISTITEYDPDVMSVALMDAKQNLSHQYSRSRRLSNFYGNLSTADILTNTWDNLKDARLVMFLEDVNKMNEKHSKNQSILPRKDSMDLPSKSANGVVESLVDKHLHKKYNSDSVLDLSKTANLPRKRTGSDVSSKTWNRKETTISNNEEYSETGLVQPLAEIRHESKVGPVKRVKISTLRKDTRCKLHRNNRTLRATNRAVKDTKIVSHDEKLGLLNSSIATLHNKTFGAIPYDSRSLSNFLLENETIPSINSATPIGHHSQTNIVKRVEPNFTRIPSLRSSRPRSMATSDLKGFQCKRALDFNRSFESDTEDVQTLENNFSDQFLEYETVLNLCTRKPRLGLAGKNTNKTMVLDKSAISDIKHAISKSNRRMNIKTNGTLNVLPKITKVGSRPQKSPRRRNSAAGCRRRTLTGRSPDLQFSTVFESEV